MRPVLNPNSTHRIKLPHDQKAPDHRRRNTIIGLAVVMAIVIGLAMLLGGCGNVYLKGEALVAAQQSSLDAYQAVQRADTAQPATIKAYLAENFKQWRSFVRAAKKDEAWGPKLEDEK